MKSYILFFVCIAVLVIYAAIHQTQPDRAIRKHTEDIKKSHIVYHAGKMSIYGDTFLFNRETKHVIDYDGNVIDSVDVFILDKNNKIKLLIKYI